MSVSTDLLKPFVEPLVLVKLAFEPPENVFEKFDSVSSWSAYGSMDNLEQSTAMTKKGDYSLKGRYTVNGNFLEAFDDASNFTAYNADTTRITTQETTFTRGTNAISFDKTGIASEFAGVTLDNFTAKDLMYRGLLAIDFYISSADLSKITKFHFVITDGSNPTTWYKASSNIHAGWNTLVMDMGNPVTDNRSYVDSQTDVHAYVETNNSTDTLTGICLDNLRVYEGPMSHVTATLDSGDSITNWFNSIGASSITLDTSTYLTGSGSIRFDKTGTGDKRCRIYKTLNDTTDMSRGRLMSCDFYIPASELSKIRTVSVFLCFVSGSTFTEYNQYRTADLVAGWNKIRFATKWPTERTVATANYGTYNVGAVTQIGFEVVTNNATDTVDDIIFDNLKYDTEGNDYDIILNPICDSADFRANPGGFVVNYGEETTYTSNGNISLKFDKPGGLVKYQGIYGMNSGALSLGEASLLALDIYFDSGDLSCLDYVYVAFEGTSGGLISWNIKAPFQAGWNRIYFNAWAPTTTSLNDYNKDNAVNLLRVYVYTDNIGDTLTDCRVNNLRLIRTDHYDSGFLSNGNFRKWSTKNDEAPDDWILSGSGATVRRQHQKIRCAEFAPKITRVSNDVKFYQSLSQYADLQTGTLTFEGTFCTDTALAARLFVDDGITTTYSDYHTGENSFERIEITKTISASASKLEVGLIVEGDCDVYFDKAIMCIGSEVDRRIVLDDFQSMDLWHIDDDIYSYGDHEADTTTFSRGKRGLTLSNTNDGYTSCLYRYCDWKLSPYTAIALDLFVDTTFNDAVDAFSMNLYLDDGRTVYSKLRVHYDDLSSGYNRLVFNVGDASGDMSSNGIYAQAHVRKVEIILNANTFSAGDIIFTNLRVFDSKPYKLIEDFNNVSDWAYSTDNKTWNIYESRARLSETGCSYGQIYVAYPNTFYGYNNIDNAEITLSVTDFYDDIINEDDDQVRLNLYILGTPSFTNVRLRIGDGTNYNDYDLGAISSSGAHNFDVTLSAPDATGGTGMDLATVDQYTIIITGTLSGANTGLVLYSQYVTTIDYMEIHGYGPVNVIETDSVNTVDGNDGMKVVRHFYDVSSTGRHISKSTVLDLSQHEFVAFKIYVPDTTTLGRISEDFRLCFSSAYTENYHSIDKDSLTVGWNTITFNLSQLTARGDLNLLTGLSFYIAGDLYNVTFDSLSVNNNLVAFIDHGTLYSGQINIGNYRIDRIDGTVEEAFDDYTDWTTDDGTLEEDFEDYTEWSTDYGTVEEGFEDHTDWDTDNLDTVEQSFETHTPWETREEIFDFEDSSLLRVDYDDIGTILPDSGPHADIGDFDTRESIWDADNQYCDTYDEGTIFVEGAGSLKQTKTSGSTESSFRSENIDGDDWSGYDHFSINYYIPDSATLAKINKVEITLFTNVLGTSYRRFNLSALTGVVLKVGWNILSWEWGDYASQDGSPDLTSIHYVRLYTTSNNSTDTFSVYWDNLRGYASEAGANEGEVTDNPDSNYYKEGSGSVYFAKTKTNSTVAFFDYSPETNDDLSDYGVLQFWVYALAPSVANENLYLTLFDGDGDYRKWKVNYTDAFSTGWNLGYICLSDTPTASSGTFNADDIEKYRFRNDVSSTTDVFIFYLDGFYATKVLDTGTLIDGFEDATNFTCARGSVADDSTDNEENINCMSMSKTSTADSWNYAERTLVTPIDLSGYDYLQISNSIPDRATADKISFLAIRLIDQSGNWSQWLIADPDGDADLVVGSLVPYLLELASTPNSSSGTLDLSDVITYRVVATCNNTTDVYSDVLWDNLRGFTSYPYSLSSSDIPAGDAICNLAELSTESSIYTEGSNSVKIAKTLSDGRSAWIHQDAMGEDYSVYTTMELSVYPDADAQANADIGLVLVDTSGNWAQWDLASAGTLNASAWNTLEATMASPDNESPSSFAASAVNDILIFANTVAASATYDTLLIDKLEGKAGVPNGAILATNIDSDYYRQGSASLKITKTNTSTANCRARLSDLAVNKDWSDYDEMELWLKSQDYANISSVKIRTIDSGDNWSQWTLAASATGVPDATWQRYSFDPNTPDSDDGTGCTMSDIDDIIVYCDSIAASAQYTNGVFFDNLLGCEDARFEPNSAELADYAGTNFEGTNSMNIKKPVTYSKYAVAKRTGVSDDWSGYNEVGIGFYINSLLDIANIYLRIVDSGGNWSQWDVKPSDVSFTYDYIDPSSEDSNGGTPCALDDIDEIWIIIESNASSDSWEDGIHVDRLYGVTADLSNTVQLSNNTTYEQYTETGLNNILMGQSNRPVSRYSWMKLENLSVNKDFSAYTYLQLFTCGLTTNEASLKLRLWDSSDNWSEWNLAAYGSLYQIKYHIATLASPDTTSATPADLSDIDDIRLLMDTEDHDAFAPSLYVQNLVGLTAIQYDAGAVSLNTDDYYFYDQCISIAKSGGLADTLRVAIDSNISPKDYDQFGFNYSPIGLIYVPVYVPSAAYDTLVASGTAMSFYFGEDIPMTTYKRWDFEKDDITADEWNFLRLDMANPSSTVGNPTYDCSRFVIETTTVSASSTFSGVLVDSPITDSIDSRLGGIKKLDFNSNVSGDSYINVWVYVPTGYASKIKCAWLALDQDPPVNQCGIWKTSTALTDGWNHLNFTLSSPDNQIDFDSSDIKDLYLFFETHDTFETMSPVYFDKFSTSQETNNTKRISKCDIMGITNGNFWEGRLLKAGKITKKMSEKEGLYSISDWSFSVADTDQFYSNFYNQVGEAPGFKNKEVTATVVTEGRPESEAVTVYNGVLDDFDYDNLTAQFKIKDISSKYFTYLPSRILESDEWSDLPEDEYESVAPLIYGAVTSDVGAIEAKYVGYYGGEYIYLVAGHACLDSSGTVYLVDSDDNVTTPTSGFTIDYDYYVNELPYTVIRVTQKKKVASVTISVAGSGYTGGSLEFDSSGTNGYDAAGSYEVDGAGAITSTKIGDSGYGYDSTPDVYPSDAGGSGAGATLTAVMENANPWEDFTVRISISGKTDNGTPFGTLLTDPVDIIEDMLINELGIDSDELDSASFDTAQTITQNRSQVAAGAVIEKTKVEDVLSEICTSHMIDMYQSNEGKLALSIFSPSRRGDSSITHYRDESEILSFKSETGINKIINRIVYRYNYNYATGEWENQDKKQDDDSIEAAGQAYDWPGGFLNFKWVRSAGVSGNVAQRQLYRYYKGRPGATIELPFAAIGHDLSDSLRITHYDGIANSREQATTTGKGWQKHLCQIRSATIDLDKYKVSFFVDNLEDIGGNCLFLGDRDTFSSSWLTATDAEKEYMYLPDRVTEKFSNGNDGGGLC